MATPCYTNVIYGPSVTVLPVDTDANVVIPLTGKHNLSSNAVYGDDEAQHLYYENTLNLEAVIHLQTSTGTSDNIEFEVARIRSILNTKGLQLKINDVGLGAIPTINVAQPDVKGGPYPQNVTVEPIASNNAVFIRWSITFRTVECPSPLSVNLLQYNVEQDFQIDDDGNLEFTVNLTYQTVTPITDPTVHGALTEILILRVGKSYQGFTKTVRTSLSRDQRIMSIRLVYKEIKSDNAFYPNISDIQIDDEMESNLLGSNAFTGIGFYSWRRSIGGTIRLPPRIHKGYAWLIFLKILKERFKGSVLSPKLSAVLDATPTSGQPVDAAAATHNFYIPLRIKFTNPLYERSMKFDVTYVMVTDLDHLINNSNIFARVNVNPTEVPPVAPEVDPTYVAATLSTQWHNWQLTRPHPLMGVFQYTLGGTPIVYNQCTGTASDHELGANTVLPLEVDPDSLGEDTENARKATNPKGEISNNKAKYSWINYDNNFEIIEDTNCVSVAFLEQPGDPNYYSSIESLGANSHRAYAGMSMHGKVTPSSQATPNITVDRGHSTNYIRMRGSALRVGYKIPIPFVSSIGGKTAKRMESRVSQKQVAKGDVPVYLAMWDITYVAVGGDVYADDILTTIKTSGAPASYT